MAGKLEVRRRELALADLATDQHGVVSRRQLRAAGFGGGAIDHRIERGRLHAVHRGVYAVGHGLLTVKGRWMAGVLAAGPGAVLSHQSAAALWDLSRLAATTHVTVAARAGQRRGLRVHCGRFEADETTVCDGIATTTVARTLLDLAAELTPDRLEWVVVEAERRRLADSPSLPELVARYPRRRGVAALRAILADRRLGLDLPRSELERRFLAFLDRRGLPRPEVNARLTVGGRTFEVDCLWRAIRLVVELDGRAWHSDPVAFEEDRARDRALVAAGWRPVRVTWRHLHRDPTGLDRELRAALCPPTSS